MAQTINVNTNPESFPATLYFSQGDIGREFDIVLASSDGYAVPAGATVTMVATKPSGFGFSVTGTLTNNVASFVTTETMTNEAGRFPAEIRIEYNGDVIGTANFYLDGEPDPHPADTIDGDAETIIPELTVLVERVESAASSVLDMQVVATTLPAGSDATYSYDEETNTAMLGIPKGADGTLSSGVLAPTYSTSATYAVGDYVYYSGSLYRCTTAITTAESWTSGHWTQVALAPEVTDLKSDFSNLRPKKVIGTNLLDATAVQRGYIVNNVSPGDVYANASYVTTPAIPIEAGKKYSVFGTYNGAVVGLSVARACAYDSSMNFISYLGALTYSSTTPNYYTAPSGASFIILSLTTANYDGFGVVMVAETDGTVMPSAVVAYKSAIMLEDVISIESFLDEKFPQEWGEASTTKQTGKYIPSTGVVTDIGLDNYVVISMNVNEGETYRITGQAYKNSYYYVFYSSSNVFVSGLKARANGTTSVEDVDVIAPIGASTLCVAASSITPHIITKKDKVLNKVHEWLGKKWVAVGDSLTEVNDKTTKNYCDYIVEATGVSVVNMGQSGSGYMRKHDTNNAFYNRIVNVPTDSDVVTIFGSLNDLGDSQQLGTIDDDVSDNTVFGYVNGTIDALFTAFPKANLGIISPTPWKSSEPWNENNGSTKYCEGLKQICYNRGIPFLDLYHCSNLRPWDATARDLFYSRDVVGGVNAGCHPDENGHKMFAPKIKNFLESLML